jgi:hypothetical protein
MKHPIDPRVPGSACFTAVAAITLSGLATAFGGVAVFEGLPGGVGAVRTYDEQSGLFIRAAQELQAITLAPIDFTGRTQLTSLLPLRPRLRSDITGANRILLPAGRGSLYRYTRVLTGGEIAFGFMHIARDGDARSLVEVTGTGPLAQVDPFVGRIAVSPTGDAFLAATTFDAGGNLLEIAIDAPQNVIDRTASVPPEIFSDAGLALGSDFGVGVSAQHVQRFARAAGAQASALSFAPDPTPAFLPGQVVLSRNGNWAATTAGADATHLHMYVFSGSGALLRGTDTPAALSIAGFAPEAGDGPFLAITDDGQTCAWRTEGVTREVYLAHTQPLVGELPIQLSASPTYLDTVDEIGLFYFRVTGQLIMGVGATPLGAPNTIEKMDVYQATLPPGGAPASIVNLSLSSGDAVPPFSHVSHIKPQNLTLLPDESHVVYLDIASSGGGEVATANSLQSGATTLFSNVRSIDLMDTAGRFAMIAIHRLDGAKPEELYRMPIGLIVPPTLLLSEPDGTRFTRSAPRRDGWMGFVVEHTNGGGGGGGGSAGESLLRAHLGTGVQQTLATTATNFGPSVFMTAQGSVALSEGVATSPSAFRIWPMSGPTVTVTAPSTPGQVLPGG